MKLISLLITVLLLLSSPITSDNPHPLADIRNISYYPSSGGWNLMWENWNRQQIETDFSRISALGFNSVRVIVQPWTFGYPQPLAVNQALLNATIEIAKSHNLGVHLTLFDLWSNYNDIDESKHWMTAILNNIDKSNLVLLEMQNEVNPLNPLAVTWLKTLIPFAKQLVKAPVSVSVSDQFGVTTLSTLHQALGKIQPDIYDYHFYEFGDYSRVNSILRAVKQAVKPVPLYIGETGRPTVVNNSNEPMDSAWQEAMQAQFIAALLATSVALHLPPPGIWTLYDFTQDAIPAGVPITASQYKYGIISADGTEKWSASIIRNFFSSKRVPSLINSSFEYGNETPAGWRIMGAELGDIQRSTKHSSGSYSVELSNTSSGLNLVPGIYMTATNALDIRAGRRYRAIAKAAGENCTGYNRIAIAWFDKEHRYMHSSESAPLPKGNFPWQVIDVTATAPKEAAFAEFHLKSENNKGSVWFDDAQFRSWESFVL